MLSLLLELLGKLVLILDALADNGFDLSWDAAFKKLTNGCFVDIVFLGANMNVEVDFAQEFNLKLVKLLDTDAS